MSSLSTPVKAIGGIAVVVGLAVVFWLVRPLFVDTVVDEAFPLSADAEVPDDMTQEEVEAEMQAAADGDPIEMDESMPVDASSATSISTGEFRDADQFHTGSGTATIYELPDGSNLLRFEDFEVTNGPDLHVYLAPLDDSGNPDIDLSGAVDLGQLSGNIGNQNYEIPADVDVDQPLGIVIWCQPFSVTFATAVLA